MQSTPASRREFAEDMSDVLMRLLGFVSYTALAAMVAATVAIKALA